MDKIQGRTANWHTHSTLDWIATEHTVHYRCVCSALAMGHIDRAVSHIDGTATTKLRYGPWGRSENTSTASPTELTLRPIGG